MTRRLLHGALMIGALFLSLGLTSCTTIETRIQEKEGAYRALSPRDQQLVREGKIHEGMSRDAVYIAWGAPSQVIPGRYRGAIVETWVYEETVAGDYPGPFYYGYPYGYGLGYGYWGGYRHRFYGGGFYGRGFYDPWYDPYFYSHANILRYPDRTVSFQNGRAIGFQQLPQPRIL